MGLSTGWVPQLYAILASATFMATLSRFMVLAPDCPVQIIAEGFVSSMALMRDGLTSSYLNGISATLILTPLIILPSYGLHASMLGFMWLPPKGSKPVSRIVFMAHTWWFDGKSLSNGPQCIMYECLG